MFLAIFGYFYLREKVSIIGLLSIILAMMGITVMIGDSISGGTLFGNLVALTIPISFSILVSLLNFKIFLALFVLPTKVLFVEGLKSFLSIFKYFL